MLNAEKILELAEEKDFESIADLARKAIIEASAKAAGGTTLLNRTRAALKYLKDNGKSGCRTWAGRTWTEEGKQCFVNGYTAFALVKPLEGLPVYTEADHMNVLPCFPSDDSHYVTAAVNIADVTATLKIWKAEHSGRHAQPCYYDVGMSRYNAQFILDCYNILGGSIVFKVPANGEIVPAICESENGKAALMPIRIKPEERAEKERAAC
jgi:hypothetical protein